MRGFYDLNHNDIFTIGLNRIFTHLMTCKLLIDKLLGVGFENYDSRH